MNMPVLTATDYAAPFLLSNRHLNTVFPTLFRRIAPALYERERIATPDNDFLDLDFSRTGSRSAVIILHGLEGNSTRVYVTGMVHIFNESGFDTVSMNFRGCSGESNKALRFYHSGETGDLETVINHISPHYDHIHLIGFSLGGNVMLKYVGEKGPSIPKNIKSAVAISVPVDLLDSSTELEKRHNSLYRMRFIRSLGEKLTEKAKAYPNDISLDGFSAIRTFREFDDRYTAPLHGFRDAEDYWRQSSSAFYLQGISIPTLLINALDDPFLGKGCYPFDAASANPNFHLETPGNGGHVGFVTFSEKYYWSEKRAWQFIQHHR